MYYNYYYIYLFNNNISYKKMRNNIILYILIQLIGIYLPIEYKNRSQLWSRIVLILNVLYKNTKNF